MQASDDHDIPDYEEPSRSQLRREALDVLKLAHALVDMSDAQLARVPLDEDLRAEVQRARAVTQQIARKRQTQYVAKQMRKLDESELEAIRASLEHDRGHARNEAAALHRVEIWRERLLAEGDDALTELMQQFPQCDRQHLRQLVRQSQTERASARAPHAQRELFRALRELFQA